VDALDRIHYYAELDAHISALVTQRGTSCD
jgi:hypothetical protein